MAHGDDGAVLAGDGAGIRGSRVCGGEREAQRKAGATKGDFHPGELKARA
jgi:hypothetical protein